MTRGKYAAKAAVRHEARTLAEQVETYQHAVARLNAENRDLRAALDAEKRAHMTDVRSLKAQLSEGVSAELTAARRMIDRLRDERDAAMRERRRIQQTWDRASGRMHRYIMRVEHLTGLEASEVLLGLCGESEADLPRTIATPDEDALVRRMGGRIDNADEQFDYGTDPSVVQPDDEMGQSQIDMVRALQRARGKRRKP